jgi:hypothetical protein
MNYETIRYTLADRILTITLDRPKQLNAFTVRMADELVHAFEAANSDDEVRAVVVTANGRAFCAGMDLSNEGNVFGLDETLRPTMRDLDERLDDAVITSRVRDTGGRVTLAIFGCTKPVIAAINHFTEEVRVQRVEHTGERECARKKSQREPEPERLDRKRGDARPREAQHLSQRKLGLTAVTLANVE